MDDDDDDLWGPPFVVQEDTLRKQTIRGCEFWFDCRTDVLEEHFQNGRYCEKVWRILHEKKEDAKIDELERDLVSLQNDMASSGSDDSHDIGGSSDSDKTLTAILPDTNTTSSKSDLDEDENTSSISDAQTLETRDSSNDTENITRFQPQDTTANDPLAVEVAEDAYTSCSPVLASKIDEVEEHSCSSLVTDQVFDPIKQAPENKSSSAISRENIGGSTLRLWLLETREKVVEKANATNEDGKVLKNHQQIDSFQDIVTASEPFTTESLLEMCDEPDNDRETSCEGISKKLHPEAVETVVKDELIINLLTDARKKAESNVVLNPKSVLMKKRQSISNSSENKGMNTSFIRNTKQKVQGETGEINLDPVKKSTPEIFKGSSVTAQHANSLLDSVDRRSERDGHIVGDLVISTMELKKKTGKELKNIAKALKVTHYYKLKKEDLLQRLTMHLTKPKLTDYTKQIIEP